MDRRQLLFGMTALAMGRSGLNDLLNAESTETANFSSSTSKAGMSDRERAGLRGRIPREQLAEAAQVKQTVRQYLVELEQQNPTEEPVQWQKVIFSNQFQGAEGRAGCLRQYQQR
jgi:hypothetical protein